MKNKMKIKTSIAYQRIREEKQNFSLTSESLQEQSRVIMFNKLLIKKPKNKK